MKNRVLIYLFLVTATISTGWAQQIAEYRFNASLAKSIKPGVLHLELGLNKDLFNFLDNDLRLGFGVRLGVQDNNNLSYTSARKAYKKDDNLVDTMVFGRTQVLSFNFNAQAEYYLKKWLAAGLAVDLIGISTGVETNAAYHPGKESTTSGYKSLSEVKTRPTSANAFSLADQKGTLNTQLFLRLEPNKNFAFRIGFACLMNEFSTELTYGSRGQYRFENNVGAYFLGVSFNKFDNK